MEKILVCITAQSNSRRLIDKGQEVAASYAGELHVLYVQKGNNIFENADSPRMLQDLFEYASARGGMVHFLSDDNVPHTIARFIRTESVTRLILGAPAAQMPPKQLAQGGELRRILAESPQAVEVVVLDRPQEAPLS